MPINRSHNPTPTTVNEWPHLHCIRDKLVPEMECEVGLLIGYDCAQALVPREVIPHPTNHGPYGQKTDLGWSVVGVVSLLDDDPIGTSHRIITSKAPLPTDVPSDIRPLCQIVTKSSIKEMMCPHPNDVLHALNHDFCEYEGPLGDEAYSAEDVNINM